MAVAIPLHATLKANIVTALQEVATAEKAVNAYRDFVVTHDRWRPWIENQQGVALVNVMVDSVKSGGGGSRQNITDLISVNIDMYVLGTHEEQTSTDPETDLETTTLVPIDEAAAARLDLLTAQVRHAITRMKNGDLGFSAGKIVPNFGAATLTIYTQEGEDSTGNYAPARYSFDVSANYTPADDSATVALTEINLAFNEALEDWGTRYVYGD